MTEKTDPQPFKWNVKGHWRKQYDPKTDTSRLVFVQPHVRRQEARSPEGEQ